MEKLRIPNLCCQRLRS